MDMNFLIFMTGLVLLGTYWLRLLATLTGTSTMEDTVLHAAEAAKERGDYPWLHQLWRPLAESGVARAQFHLGVLYYHGLGVPPNLAEARHWWGAAAAQGQGAAQFNMGLLNQRGEGGPRDEERARHWYEKAVANGQSKAEGLLGLMLLNGEGGPREPKRGLRLLRKAARRGEVQALVNLAIYHYRCQHYRRARHHCRRALASGEPRARALLGLLLATGQGGWKNPKKARWLFEEAGDDPRALLGLGMLYAEGLGVPRDYHRARRYLEQADARAGDDGEMRAAVAQALDQLAEREAAATG